MTLNEIIKRVDELKAELDALRPIEPEQEQRIRQKLRLDWNYHSNAIEGNTLTLGETRAFLLHGITAKGKPFKDYLDIKGHNEAITHLEDFVRGQRTLTEADLRELHKILLVEPYEVDALTADGKLTRKRIALGQYKTTPNHVRTSTGQIHYYATPEETPAKMGDLMQWYRKETDKGELHPLILAATFHYRFVAIHPFDDGNGRMARLLMNLILMQAGYVPVIVRLGSREEYLLALEKADAGELEDFIILMGEELIQSLQLTLKGARGESIEELDDLDKKVALLQKQLEGEEFIFTVEKGLNTQRMLFTNLIKPLLENLFSKFKKFATFFNRSICWLNKQQGGVGPDRPEVLLNRLSGIIKSSISPIDEINISYEFISLVKDENYNIEFVLVFNLKKYEFNIIYSIRDKIDNPILEQEELVKGTYDTTFTAEEINRLAFLVANQIYELIEQQVNKPSNQDSPS